MAKAALRQPQVRSLERGLDIIQQLSVHGALTCTEVGARTGLNRITAYRLLETLAGLGYVLRDDVTKLYSLSELVLSLAAGHRSDPWRSDKVRDIVHAAGATIKWPVIFAVNGGGHMIVRQSTRTLSPYKFMERSLGRPIPVLRSAVGQIYLACCEKQIRLDLIRLALTQGTPEHPRHEKILNADIAAMEDELARVRKRGFGYLDASWQNANLITSAIAVPVFEGENIAGALAVIYFRMAMPFREAKERFLPELIRAAAAIGAAAVAPASSP